MDIGYDEDRQRRMLRDRVQARWSSAYAPVRHLDPVLVLTALTLTAIGLVAVYSAKLVTLSAQDLPTTYYVTRQLLALGLGVVAMVMAAVIDYRQVRVYAPVLYVVGLILLVLTLTPLGTEINGSQRWLLIGGFQLQPSELVKLAVLATIAAILHESQGSPHVGRIAGALLLTLVPAGLVFLQPDLGTSLVFVWGTAVLFLVGGVKTRYLAGLAGGALVAAGLGIQQLESYQLTRLTAFLDAADASAAQSTAFQTRQSLIAIGSGQFAGKGLFEGTQTSLSYVPENHTDFIFTVIGEEFGFVGAAVVLGLFLVLVWRGLRIAILSKDTFGTLVASGIVATLTLQVFVNVGMTVGIMPVTGMPLPFISYGGTSLIVWFAMIGLLLNVHMRRF
ncbi:MAG: rod shape-determining protein RodA [Actinomycetota bacterium]